MPMIRTDIAVFILAMTVTVGCFTALLIDRITVVDFSALSGPAWAFWFGRVNGRAQLGDLPKRVEEAVAKMESLP